MHASIHDIYLHTTRAAIPNCMHAGGRQRLSSVPLLARPLKLGAAILEM